MYLQKQREREREMSISAYLCMYQSIKMNQNAWRCPRGVMVKATDCGIVVSDYIYIYIYIYKKHTISFQTFFVWALLLIVHT